MADTEKMVEDLERVMKICNNFTAAVPESVILPTNLVFKVITMLNTASEQQKPVKPERSGKGTTWYYCCGACAQPIDPGDPYCRRCGKAVKWDG